VVLLGSPEDVWVSDELIKPWGAPMSTDLVPLHSARLPLRAKPIRIVVPAYKPQARKLTDYIKDWIGSLAGKNASENTIRNYETAGGQFAGFVVLTRGLDDDLSSFTGRVVSEWSQFMIGAGMKSDTVAIRLSAIKMFGRFLMRTERTDGRGYVLDTNPVDRVESPRRVRRKKAHLDQDSLVRFFITDTHEHVDLARLVLLSTALRASEICRLNVSDLVKDDKGYGLHVILKGGREKIISIPTEVAQRLIASLEERRAGQHEPLLLNGLGQRWKRTTLSETFARLGKKAGLPTRSATHIFRASLNVIARRVAGLDVQQRAALLNHANTTTIATYDRLDSMDEERGARDAVWGAFNRIVEERSGK
jgi:site-specific recombinase XerC